MSLSRLVISPSLPHSSLICFPSSLPTLLAFNFLDAYDTVTRAAVRLAQFLRSTLSLSREASRLHFPKGH